MIPRYKQNGGMSRDEDGNFVRWSDAIAVITQLEEEIAVLRGPCEGGRASDLKPCPFCGGKAIMLKDHTAFGFYVSCKERETSGKTAGKDEASSTWNRRSPPPPAEKGSQP